MLYYIIWYHMILYDMLLYDTIWYDINLDYTTILTPLITNQWKLWYLPIWVDRYFLTVKSCSTIQNTIILHILMVSSWQFVDHRLNVKRVVEYELGVSHSKQPPSHERPCKKWQGSDVFEFPNSWETRWNAQPAENQSV